MLYVAREQTNRSLRRDGCTSRRAFSLIELILVVSIIGVLSAIAIPRLSRASEGADYAAQHRDWQTVQKQIELYAIEHYGVYPGAATDGTSPARTEAAFMRQMTRYTDANGAASNSKTAQYSYGPYLRTGLPPIKYGPKMGLTSLKCVNAVAQLAYQPLANAGWLYYPGTGDIRPNVPDRTDVPTELIPVTDFSAFDTP